MGHRDHYVLDLGNSNDQSSKKKGCFAIVRSWRRLSRLQRTLITLVICIITTLFLREVVFKPGSRLRQNYPSQLSEQKQSKDERLEQVEKPVLEPKNSEERKELPEKIPGVLPPPNLGASKTGGSSAALSQQQAVVEAFKHSWKAYKLYAWGQDEVHPLTHTSSTWMGAALTMVDALDTMWLMGLKEEYKEARDWIEANLNFNLDKDHVNVFETTIRLLGGLLSVYYFTKDEMFLKKAVDLGNRLTPAFDTASSLPLSDINLSRGTAQSPAWTRDSSTAEVATLSLEFIALAKASGVKKFQTLVDNLTLRLHKAAKKDGLVPIYVNPDTGQFRSGSTISLGARGDTYYEYILKQWIQTNKTVDFLRTDYLESVAGIKKHLLRRSRPKNLLFVGELTGGHSFYNKMDHLVCFLPGTLAYGVLHGMPQDHLRIAKQLMFTCNEMYRQMPTGLSPEIAHFNMEANSKQDIYVKPLDKHNLQRPETIESLFYLYRITKEKKYRDWGWRIFQSFEKYTKVSPAGYVSISDVTSPDNVRQRTKCESFWFAETLKYFFLLFSDDSVVDLKHYVINTEAHPLPLG